MKRKTVIKKKPVSRAAAKKVVRPGGSLRVQSSRKVTASRR